MLRLSRFRGRHGVIGRSIDYVGAACSSEGEMQAPACRAIGNASSRLLSRTFSEDAGDENKEEATKGGSDRGAILTAIEKDRGLQDEVGKFLYGTARGPIDPKLLLGSLYLKAGLRVPTYSSKPSEGQYMGSVVATGKRFRGIPASSQEEAERNAAVSVLNWVLGRPKKATLPEASVRGGRGRGRGGGRGEQRGGRGRGRDGSGPRGKCAQHVATKPIGCMQLEVNYKIMKAVVLYPTQEILYPYKEFPARQDLKSLYLKEKNEEEPQV